MQLSFQICLLTLCLAALTIEGAKIEARQAATTTTVAASAPATATTGAFGSTFRPSDVVSSVSGSLTSVASTGSVRSTSTVTSSSHSSSSSSAQPSSGGSNGAVLITRLDGSTVVVSALFAFLGSLVVLVAA